MKSKIVYNPSLTIEDNATNNKVSVAAIRKFILTQNIDRRYDEKLKKFRNIHELKKAHPNWTNQQLADKSGFSLSSVKRYLKMGFNFDTKKVSILNLSRQSGIIKTISYDQSEILVSILRLYVKTDTFDCDLTASIGVFYRNLPLPKYLFDKFPQMDGVLPLEEAYRISEGSLNSVVYDLPFIIRSGHCEKASLIGERFTFFNSEDELLQANIQMLKLSFRLLKKKGFLIVKTMDTYYVNRQIWVEHFIQTKALEMGFEMKDMFILLSKSRYFRNQFMVQRSARKYHSYFLVFQKRSC